MCRLNSAPTPNTELTGQHLFSFGYHPLTFDEASFFSRIPRTHFQTMPPKKLAKHTYCGIDPIAGSGHSSCTNERNNHCRGCYKFYCNFCSGDHSFKSTVFVFLSYNNKHIERKIFLIDNMKMKDRRPFIKILLIEAS